MQRHTRIITCWCSFVSDVRKSGCCEMIPTCRKRNTGTVLHEPAEHARRRPRLRPRQRVAYVERSIQMPKFRVRCDNPKTDFESASLHTARAAAKDVSLRAHEPVLVLEVTEDGAENVVHTDPPRHPDLRR